MLCVYLLASHIGGEDYGTDLATRRSVPQPSASAAGGPPKQVETDYNVWSQKKRIEKLRYFHRNPVRRGPVKKPEDWTWNSFRHYATGEEGVVAIESGWTGRSDWECR